jgi:serine/threonine protein kinase
MPTTTVLGTSAYMAPEAFRGDVSVKLDTFSFGVVSLQCLENWHVTVLVCFCACIFDKFWCFSDFITVLSFLLVMLLCRIK